MIWLFYIKSVAIILLKRFSLNTIYSEVEQMYDEESPKMNSRHGWHFFLLSPAQLATTVLALTPITVPPGARPPIKRARAKQLFVSALCGPIIVH